MKKIVLCLALMMSFFAQAQIFNGWKSNGKTTSQIEAIPNDAGRFEYNSTTGTLWYNDGTDWVDLGDGSGGSGTVDTSGTPSSGQAAEFTGATTIQGVGTTGSGNYVKANSPELTTPNLGTPSAITLTNATGLPEAQVTQHEGAIDHGSIAGLSDDDHTQYHNDARAAAWLAGLYANLDTDATNDATLAGNNVFTGTNRFIATAGADPFRINGRSSDNVGILSFYNNANSTAFGGVGWITSPATGIGLFNSISGQSIILEDGTGITASGYITASGFIISGGSGANVLLDDGGATPLSSINTDDQTASEVSVNAAGFDGNLATTDDTVQEVAQKVDDLVLGSPGGSLVANELAIGSDVADADHAGVRNVMLLAGTANVEIPADATYNHPVGTLLYYSTQTFEGLINVTFEAGVTGTARSTGTEYGPNLYYLKTAANQWKTIASDWTGVSAHPDTGQSGIRIGVGTEAEKAGATLGAADVWISTDAKTPEVLAIACSDLTTNVTTGTSKAYFRMPWAATLTGVKVSLLTAGTSTGLTVDINEGGTTVLSTKLTTDATEATSATAATPAVISDASLANDAIITFDFDAVPTGGKGVIVYLYVEH